MNLRIFDYIFPLFTHNPIKLNLFKRDNTCVVLVLRKTYLSLRVPFLRVLLFYYPNINFLEDIKTVPLLTVIRIRERGSRKSDHSTFCPGKYIFGGFEMISFPPMKVSPTGSVSIVFFVWRDVIAFVWSSALKRGFVGSLYCSPQLRAIKENSIEFTEQSVKILFFLNIE